MEGTAKEEKAFELNEDKGSLKDENSLKEKELNHANAKMLEAREENQRLRRSLSQIMKDYQILQMQYNDIISRDSFNGSKTNKPPTQSYQETDEPNHIISLSLGRASSSSEKVLRNEVEVIESKEGLKEKEKEGLSLGLDCKYEMSKKPSPESSAELVKEESERDLANKSGSLLRCEDDEISQHNPTKRARVSVRVRCDTPTMNDGCQWRKYGQKIAKGNPCPRAYYRCTVAPSCPVRKQVQRCAKDMSILITTYEGKHNHPLPPSATALVSATSAAASMLLSGSATSSPFLATSSSNTHGLNSLINPYDLSKSKQIYIPNNYSTSSTNPMIILDLTSPSSYNSIFNTFSSNYHSSPNSSTNLSFNPLESNPLPLSWSRSNQNCNSLNFGGQYSTNEQNIYKPFIQNPNPNSQQQTLEHEAIAAATKAITSDPGFQSALITALSSIVGNRGNGKNIVEAYPGVSNFPPTSTQNGFNLSSSYLNRNSKVIEVQQKNVGLFQPQIPFDSTRKSKSPSPSDEDTL